MGLTNEEMIEYKNLSSLDELTDFQINRLKALEKKAEVEEYVVDDKSFWDKAGEVANQMVGKDTAFGHLARDIIKFPQSEKLTRAIFNPITKGLEKIQDTAAGSPTADTLLSPFKTALSVGKFVSESLAEGGIGLLDVAPVIGRLKFLSTAPAAVKAAELSKLKSEVKPEVLKKAMDTLSPEELQAITGTPEKVKAAVSFVPPENWKTINRELDKPFTLGSAISDKERVALESLKNKLQNKPITQTIENASENITKKIEGGVGEGFTGNINLTKYPKPVADLITEVNKKTGFAERATQTIPEIKTIGATPEAQELFKKIVSSPEGAVPGAIQNAREVFTNEAKVVLENVGDIVNFGENEFKKIESLVKKGEEISKSAKMAGQSLRVFKESTDDKIAQQLVDKVEELKLKIKANQSPLSKPYIDALTSLQQAISKKAFDLSQTSKYYREAMKLADQGFYVYLNSLLSSPLTHLRNISGSVVMAGLKPVEKVMSAAFDNILSKMPGGVKPEHAFREAIEQLKGAGKWVLGKGEKIELESASKLDNQLENPIGGVAGKIIGFPLKALKVEDDISKSLIAQMENAGLKSKGIEGEALKKAVNQEALYRTFQDQSGPIINAMSSLREKMPMARWVIPFLKTPSKIFVRGIERSPLGYGKVAYKTLKGGYKQADMAQDLGNATLGSMASAFLAWHYGKGNITGSYPTDKDEKERWLAEGITPYSVKIQGRWVPLDRIEPIGTIVKTAVASIDAFKDNPDDKIENQAENVALRLGKELTSQSALNGFNVMARALSEPDRYAGKTVSNIATGFIPGISKFAVNLTDEYARNKQGIIETAKSKIPGLSKTLPPLRDILGNPIENDIFIGRKAKDVPELEFANSLGVDLPDTKKIFNPISPINTKEQDAYRLYVGIRLKGLLQQEMFNPTYIDENKERKFIESNIKDFVENGKAIANTSAEIRRLGVNAKITDDVGIFLYKNVLKDKRYKSLSDEQKKEIINKAILIQER